jgi:hypothetical protein
VARRSWLSLVLLLSARPAEAKPTAGLELGWQAPSECPNEAGVREQIEGLVDAPIDMSAPRSVRADGQVTREDDGYHLELVLQDGELVGERTFDGDSCAEVTGAAAVAIALLLRSASEEAAAETTSRDPAAHTSTSNDATDPASEIAQGEERARLEVVLLAPTLSAGLGLFSSPSLRLGAGVALEPGRWRFALTGTWHPDLVLPVAEIPGTTVSASRQTISAAGCHFLLIDVVELAPCLTVSLQFLSAGGTGTDITPSQASTAWLALGPTAYNRLRLGPTFALTTYMGFEVETARPRLVIDGLGTVEQMGPLEFTVGMGTEWIF